MLPNLTTTRHLCRKLVMLFALFMLNVSVFSQISDPTPPTPNAGSIRKFIDYPVGSYTGSIPIDIPLFNIVAGDISVPISLSYHSGGVLVSEEAGWVGTNWTLNAGGMINQTIKGNDDFGPIGLFNSLEMIDPICTPQNTPPEEIELWDYPPGYNGFCDGVEFLGSFSQIHSGKPLVDGVISTDTHYESEFNNDWEPDMFSFSMPGGSGRFAATQDRKFCLLEQQNIKIVERYYDGYWNLIDAGGRTYTFARREDTLDMGVLTGRTWYLVKITSAAGNREVTFEYEDGPDLAMTHLDWNFSETVVPSCAECALGTGSVSRVYTRHYTPVYLKRITIDDGVYYEFTRKQTQREDLYGEYALEYIRQFDANNTLLKEFELVTDYVMSVTKAPNPLAVYATEQERNYDYKRLFLTKLIEKGGDERLVTEFEYDNTKLPQKTSFAKDHWGYYNGRENNTLLPSFELKVNGHVNSGPVWYKPTGADREASEEHAKAGILTQITYPTGGKTTFDYSVHRYRQQWSTWKAAAPVRTYKHYYNGGNLSQSGPISQPIQSGRQLETAMVEVVGQCDGCNYLYSSYVDISFGGQSMRLNFETLKHLFQLSVTEETFGDTYRITFKKRLSELFTWSANGTFTAEIGSPANAIFNIEVTLRYEVETVGDFKLGGGLRLSRKEDIDENGMSRVIELAYEENGNHYGKLFSQPAYVNIRKDDEYGWIVAIVSSSSLSKPAGAVGGNVGYSKVIVKHGVDGVFGKTVYSYHNEVDVWPEYTGRPPSIMKVPDVLNGKLVAKADYKNDNGVFEVVQIDSSFYEVAMRVRIPAIACEPVLTVGFGFVRQDLHYYPIYSTWVRQVRSSSCQFTPVGTFYTQRISHFKPVTDSNGNTFGSYLTQHPTEEQFPPDEWPKQFAPATVASFASDGKVITTAYLYPEDFTAPALAVQKMIELNMDETPIIEHTAVDGKIVAAQARLFDYDPNNAKVNLIGVYNLEVEDPITSLSNGATGVQFDPRLKEEARVLRRDLMGNVLELVGRDNIHISYLYGYNNTVPVAKIVNATYDQVSQLLSSSDLNALKLKSPSDVQIRNVVSKVRQGLTGAMVTSYTHMPGVGVSSITDVNGLTSTFQYDAMGRLHFVKDPDGNLVQEVRYHYRNRE